MIILPPLSLSLPHHLFLTHTGTLDDTIDVDGLSLRDVRKGTKKIESESVYKKSEELEAKRRTFLKELQVTKASLELVFRTENFNDLTGKDFIAFNFIFLRLLLVLL